MQYYYCCSPTTRKDNMSGESCRVKEIDPPTKQRIKEAEGRQGREKRKKKRKEKKRYDYRTQKEKKKKPAERHKTTTPAALSNLKQSQKR
jgi:sRNA-binding protein